MIQHNYQWSTQKYIDEVEHGTDKGLLEYQKVELDYLTTKIKSPENKIIVDVGAGYGRVLPPLAKIAKRFIAIEIDPDLLQELHGRATMFPNSEVIEKDGTNLSVLLGDMNLTNPVIISPQNTLGPWVGDRNKAIDEMRKVAEPKHGEIIVSVFCREAIKDWGIPMYESIHGLLGHYDPKSSNLKKGIYKSDTGYESYWFSKDEREEIKKRLGGKVISEVLDHKFHIFHISYA